MKKISTSALARKLNIEGKELFKLFEEKGFIFRNEDHWELTEKGYETWAEMKTTPKFGTYIVWDENCDPYEFLDIKKVEFISASVIAETFNTSARRMNQILSELWYIEPNVKGWKLTTLWEQIWAKEYEHTSWGTYVKWNSDILLNKSLLRSLWLEAPVEDKQAEDKEDKKETKTPEEIFRAKFPAQYRTKDWHNVRSRGEVIIDNSLYEYGLAHAYERKLPVEEDVYSDFYIPSQDGHKAVYIEYWGLEDQERYEERKKVKKAIYDKYNLNLIELTNKHIDNLDDYLPRMLLEFGIRVD